jgi:predicted phage baseplate assembly protein
MVRGDAAAGPPAIPPATAEGGPLAPAPPHFPPSELIFGDGVDGAGLPAGTWRIEASYRSGIGTLGNVPAGSLSVIQRAPRGLMAVTNPLPAGGGVDPETMAEARERAPRGLRAMERVVSAADIEDFARGYTGVSKVRADLLAAGRRRLLHLTIADADTDEGSLMAEALAGAIEARRAAPTPPLYVARCEIVRFRVRARLLIEPAHWARHEQILAEARGALVAAFSFAARGLAQGVAPSELIGLLQRLPGVAAVELRSPDRGSLPWPRQPLVAQGARLQGNRPLPAQLLLIDATADDGIVVEAEP